MGRTFCSWSHIPVPLQVGINAFMREHPEWESVELSSTVHDFGYARSNRLFEMAAYYDQLTKLNEVMRALGGDQEMIDELVRRSKAATQLKDLASAVRAAEDRAILSRI